MALKSASKLDSEHLDPHVEPQATDRCRFCVQVEDTLLGSGEGDAIGETGKIFGFEIRWQIVLGHWWAMRWNEVAI